MSHGKAGNSCLGVRYSSPTDGMAICHKYTANTFLSLCIGQEQFAHKGDIPQRETLDKLIHKAEQLLIRMSDSYEKHSKIEMDWIPNKNNGKDQGCILASS